jgi:thiamine biosynthesis lipoprotein
MLARILAALLILFWTAAAVLRADESTKLHRYRRAAVHMGVEFEVLLFAPDEAAANQAIDKALARIAELDQKLSDYALDSELSQLSATSARRGEDTGPPAAVKVSDDLWAVLAQSQELARQSGGAFDVTIGPLTKLWRRARRWKELPEPDALATARQSVGYQFLKLDPAAHTAQLLKPNMRLDLGGIAKGYAADEAVKVVKSCGISHVLVRASGDIATAQPPPGEPGWQVGIAPLNPAEPPKRFVALANHAISTSGDSRQHLVVSGRRYSHIIDPRTGECVSGRSSVSVIAPYGTQADGLATAASVLGPDAALELIEKFPGVELLLVYEDEAGRQRIVETPGFKRFEVKGP